ncbi:MAG: thermonuclease family protein [Tannerella sp.]|jgi:endonuclease YncB( thermonuclease family)|nr:thermonuclease family protein [Tannerella sp.]
MRRILFLFGLLTLSLAINAQTIAGKVVRVADGDTFTLLDESNNQVRVRLYGIDCPEKKQDFGEKARLETGRCPLSQIRL